MTLLILAILLGYGGPIDFYKLKRKIRTTRNEEEAEFTESEARFLERILKRFGKRLPEQGPA